MLEALNFVAALVGYIVLLFILAATILQKLEAIIDLQIVAVHIVTGRVDEFCIFRGQLESDDFDDIDTVIAEPVEEQEEIDRSEADTEPPQPEKPEEDAG